MDSADEMAQCRNCAAHMLAEGRSWSFMQGMTGCNRSTLAKVSKRAQVRHESGIGRKKRKTAARSFKGLWCWPRELRQALEDNGRLTKSPYFAAAIQSSRLRLEPLVFDHKR